MLRRACTITTNAVPGFAGEHAATKGCAPGTAGLPLRDDPAVASSDPLSRHEPMDEADYREPQ